MIQELRIASDTLRIAIDQYLDVCSTFRDSYLGAIASRDVPQEILNTTSNEVLRLISFETKLKQSKAAISITRNTAPRIVPITALPAEILARIFQLVLCPPSPPKDAPTKLLPQDLLSHVCSRWRQIATSSPTLWSYVGIALRGLSYDHALHRAETYATRAYPTVLDVGIHVSDETSRLGLSHPANLLQLTDSLAPRTRSLNLHTRSAENRLSHLLLERLFASGIPGVLTTVAIWARGEKTDPRSHCFIQSVDSPWPRARQSILLEMPHQLLEELWHPIRILRLSGLYPRWTSKAYHGLTELHLESGRLLPISEANLVDVLLASPGLKTLAVDLVVIGTPAQTHSNIPVRLEELEVLSFEAIEQFDQGTDTLIANFLRLIAPGPKPLSLSLFLVGNIDRNMSHGDVARFFARSYITELSLGGFGTYLAVSKALRVLPHIRKLHLEALSATDNYAPPPTATGMENVPRVVLDSLTIMYSEIDLAALRRLIEENMTVRSLSVLQCFTLDGQTALSAEMFENALSGLCPVTTAAQPKTFYSWSQGWKQDP